MASGVGAAMLLGRVLLAGPLLAQDAAAPAGFVVLLGEDTIAVERFERTGPSLEGVLADRLTGRWLTYRLRGAEDFTAERFELEIRPAAEPGSEPLMTAEIDFRGDSAFAEVRGSPAPPHQRLGTREGAIPFLNLSFALVEHVILRARAMGEGSVELPLFLVGNGQTITAGVESLPGDSVRVMLGPVEFRGVIDTAGRLLGGHVPSQGVEVRRSEAPGRVGAAAPPDYSAPPGAPYVAEEVSIRGPGGHTLAGTLTRPREATGPVPAAVLITGSGLQDRDEALAAVPGYRPFRDIADTLTRRGIVVLRMDDRGFGASTGDVRNATTADFAEDFRAAVAYLRGRPDMDSSRIALVGHSEGGLIALMVAGTDPTIGAIVTLAGPSRTGREILRYQNAFAIERDTSIAPVARDSALAAAMERVDSLAAVHAWIAWFLDHDPLAEARRVRSPALILQGATDTQITPDQAEELGAAMREGGNPDVTVRVYPDVNHLFLDDPDGDPAGYARLPSKSVARRVLADLAEWLSERLR